MAKRKLNHLTKFDGFIYITITLFSLFCTLPMLLVFIVSITEESAIAKNGYSFFPEQLSLEAYRLIFNGSSSVFRSFGISVFVTVCGTLLSVIITSMCAFTLANKNVKYRNGLAFFFFFTMLFNAGLVPWFMMCRNLGLYNNVLALIIPGLVFNPYNMFLVRNYMAGIPDSLMESAKLDGANELVIAFRIYFPLSLPVLAAVTLFYALSYWNDWWNAIMLVDDSKLYPLQYLLFRLQSEIQMLKDLQLRSAGGAVKLPAESVKMATVIVTVGPIIFLYPYLQKHFVKGLVIGGVKG